MTTVTTAARQRVHRLAATLALTSWLTLASMVSGQAPPPRVSFDEAIGLSAQTPTVREAQAGLGARLANDEGVGGSAGTTQLTFMPGFNRAPDPADPDFEFQLTLIQGWNLQRLGPRARDAARAERAQLSARVRAQALSARTEAAKAWIDLRTLERIETRLEQARSLGARHIRESERALQAGAATAADVARARAAAGELEELLLDVHGARFDAATRLSLAIGRAMPPAASHAPPLSTGGHLPAPVLPDESQQPEYMARLAAAPEVAVKRLAVRAARAREVETEARYAPLLQTGAQLERANDTWVLYGIAGVNFRPNGDVDRARSQALAESAEAAARAQSAELSASAELSRAWHEVDHERRREELCEQRLLPAAETLAQRQSEALEAGTGTVFEWIDAKRRALDAHVRCERASGASLWARVRLWLLLAALDGGNDK